VRRIPFGRKKPSRQWIKKAEGLLAELEAAVDADARNKIIDQNKAVWGELKEWLLKHSHGKCWFSEVKEGFSHWDVEHYRPKKSARDEDGTEHDGYWWLAFDWENFRICGNAGNRKKGTFFPLRPGCPRIGPKGDIRHEEPLLLDPVDDHDPTLLFFSIEGRAVAAPHVKDDWEKARVQYSIDRYNLDFSQLMDKRRTVWDTCWNTIREYRRELALYHKDPRNLIARDRATQACKQLRTMAKDDVELSAVARACMQSAGDKYLDGILRTL